MTKKNRKLLWRDNRDTCRTKKMDANKVWQWRIMHVKKCSRHPQPFYHSNRVELDFNIASSTKKKLDLQLVTNAVILEVCDFAKTVNKGKRHFLTNILENNFDLGLENEQQRIDFTARIHYKVKELIRKPPEDRNEVFTLFDTSKPECNSNNGLTKASTERKTERFPMEMDDTDDSEQEDDFLCSWEPSNGNIKTECLFDEMDGAPDEDREHEDELRVSASLSTEELKEDFLTTQFPYCEEIGLNFDVGSKQRLDPDLLTKGVMLELEHVTRILTASYSPIVLGVLEHNFDLDLKSQQRRNRVWFKISQLLRRRKRLFNTFRKMRLDFENEPYSFETANMVDSQFHFKEVTQGRQPDFKNKQRKRALFTTDERANKRCRKGLSQDTETNSLSHHTDLCTSQTAEWDYDDSCPLGESDDDDSDTVTNQSPKDCSLTSDILRQSESSYLGTGAPLLILNDISSSLPAVNSNVNTSASQPDKIGFHGGEEQTQTPRNETYECDIEQEEIETENMWKWRARRVEQILSEVGPFTFSKRVGLEFNVGFGPRQNISVDSTFECALPEIAKFALAMNSSQQNFIMEILEYNFDLYFQSEHQRNDFMCNIMDTVRQLKDCQDGVKCSEEIFDLPSSLTTQDQDVQTVSSVKPEFSDEYKTEECDVAPTCHSQSHAQSEEHFSPAIVDPYPICKEIGLRLNVNPHHQNQKLDINKLTNGAMTEVINFAEKLCGTFEQICLDILRHNLDPDLQSGDSDLAQNIVARIPAVVERKNLVIFSQNYRNIMAKRNYSSRMQNLDCHNNQNLDACSVGSSQYAVLDAGRFPYIKNQKELSLLLWKLRANHIQQILSVPHGENCLLYSYSRCKKLGIDFDVTSGLKQKLDSTLLTNGIMVEMLTFATELLSAQKYFITEILEFNFHLNFHNELYRSAFAHNVCFKINSVARRIKQKIMTQSKKGFELPDMRSLKITFSDRVMRCPKCTQEREHMIRDNGTGQGQMHHPRPQTMTKEACKRAQRPSEDPSSTFTAIEEMIMDRYPLCKKMGLKLCLNKDKRREALDVRELTFGIMFEVAHFTNVLCSTKNKIINTLLKHNFNIDTERHNTNILKLFGRAKALEDGEMAWFSKVFVPQPVRCTKPKPACKRKGSPVMQIRKRRRTVQNRQLALQMEKERATLPSYNNSNSVIEREVMGTKWDYTCPLGESDLDSDGNTDSENFGNQDHLHNTKRFSLSSDIRRQSKSNCLDIGACVVILRDIRPSLPVMNSNVNTSASQKGLCGEEQTRTPRNEPNEYDTEQKGTRTENIMWKLRANRVKQIRSEVGPFTFSERDSLEYNVGFGPKQNISVDSLHSSALLEVARFALAMNASQQNFIMEILEYNFDFSGLSEHQKNLFTCEIMDSVRKLKDCEDAVKFSKVIFGLPSLLTAQDQKVQSVDSVSPEIDRMSLPEDNDLATCHPDSHAETEEPAIMDPYPFCKEIGLKLHVNQRKQNKKLDINKLTKGAVTEMTNFAEELCGTFEQICLDIIRHNVDLDMQSEDCDLAQNLIDQIPFLMQRKNISICVKSFNKIKKYREVTPTSGRTKRDRQDIQNSDACSAGSSQAPVKDLNVSSSPENQKELNLLLWKLRANHIQELLSIPHVEHCPLYPYSRCKKLGIDFNVASGVRQKLDPKLLTNGIMVEICMFVTELLSAQRFFITEILEFNFNFNFHNELYRSVFTQQTWGKVHLILEQKDCQKRRKRVFKLPDMNSIQKAALEKATVCPKCYQEREQRLCQDETEPDHTHHPHPHTMTTGNCQTQKPAKDQFSTFAAIEEMIMGRYPLCKKMGLTLCVNKDKPKEKLNLNYLTYEAMMEVFKFAKELCSTKTKIINGVLEHNFDVSMQGRIIDFTQLFGRANAQKVGRHAWFSEPFVAKSVSCRKPPLVSKRGMKSNQIKSTSADIAPCLQPCSPKSLTEQDMASVISAVQIYERKETIKKRKLALQSKAESATLLSHSTSVVKVKRNCQSKVQVNSYPICTEIGLDLDVTSKSGKKEKLDLKLLTRAVVCEIHKFAVKQNGRRVLRTLFDILDYNFDLSSQYYRRWEFSKATSSKVRAMVRQQKKNIYKPDKVFQLPFVFPTEEIQNKEPVKCSREKPRKRRVKSHSDDSPHHSSYRLQFDEENWSYEEDPNIPRDPWGMEPMCGSTERGGCDVPLPENIQIQGEEYDPHFVDLKQEPDTEEKYHPHCDDVKTESTTEDVAHVDPAVPTGPFVHSTVTLWPNCDKMQPEIANQCLQYYVLAEPRGSAVDPNTATNIKTERDTDGVDNLLPVKSAGSHEYFMVTTDQSKEGKWIKEEQEHEPGDLDHEFTEDEVGI